jgi:hypothetical protein
MKNSIYLMSLSSSFHENATPLHQQTHVHPSCYSDLFLSYKIKLLHYHGFRKRTAHGISKQMLNKPLKTSSVKFGDQ